MLSWWGSARRGAVPSGIHWVLCGLVVLVVVHLLVPLVMWVQRDELREGVATSNPTLTSVELKWAVIVILGASLVFHLAFVGLYFWLGFKVCDGRRWARIALTTALVIGTLASVVSFSLSPMFRVIIPATDLLQIVLIALLWLPQSSRQHFAVARSDRERPGDRRAAHHVSFEA